MALPPKKPRPDNPKFAGRPAKNKGPVPPQAKNLTPPNATGVKSGKPKKKSGGKVGIGSGKNGMYW